jgi:hypothetical protein
VLDTYELRARFLPAVLAIAPAIVAALLLWPSASSVGVKIVALLGTLGVPFVVTQFIQDRGNLLQEDLWHLWGGPPTTQLLRYRNNPEPLHRERRRANVQAVVRSVPQLPGDALESTQPDLATAQYAGAVAELRDRLRDKDRYPTVFHANVAYGFRRNCLVVRGIAIRVALAATILDTGVVATALTGVVRLNTGASLAWAVGAVSSVVAAVTWGRWVTVSGVRPAAFRYARALLDAAASADDA